MQARKPDVVHADDVTLGNRVADAVASGMGSWAFIITQTVFVVIWMTANVVGYIRHWDSYPFILLNLLFSTQAAYAAPIIMMSQNRQAAKDRLRDDHEAQEVDNLFKNHELLMTVNQTQLEILQRLDGLSSKEANDGV